ncbi:MULTISPECIES: hypothetical protein [Cohnella]|uniref:hypothetical protein n=1 Tax=Cohnella TaxID=329857 RepID=UPI0009BB25B0|nr:MULTISPECIES: hypothetical protein [Cohnella]MBN2982582.1 hypothetical protein [Cohnella algarum]
MEQMQELKNTLSYLHSELNRIETMAGTLSTIEHDHFTKLNGFDHRGLADIAVEEQQASRQLGTIKHMCLSMAQKIDGLRQSLDGGDPKESKRHAETH